MRSTDVIENATTASGLPAMGDIDWGSHICQFYRNQDELAEVLVPFIHTGLQRSERCVWITAEPFTAHEARERLRDVMPDIDERIARGQIEIVDHAECYLQDGELSTDALLAMWLEREREALREGYAGLRLSGNTFWLERDDWRSFVEYEARVHQAFHGRRIIGLCSYALPRCGANEVLDVLRNHRCALVHRDGVWQSVQSATLLLGEDREDVLVRLQQLTSALDEARSPAQIADVVAAGLSRAFGADQTVLGLVDGEPTRLLVIGRRNTPSALCENLTVIDDDAGVPVADVHRNSLPLWIGTRTALAARFPDFVAEFPRTAAVGCVPLRVGARRIGALGLAFHEERTLAVGERALLDDYARHVALALERALSYEAATQARNRLQWLADATEHIARARLDVQQLLDTIARELARPGFADCCAIHLTTPEGGALQLGSLHHLDDEAGALARRTLEQFPVELGEGLVGGVAQAGQSVRICGEQAALSASKPEYREYLQRFPVSSLVVVPMRASGELLGTLTASRTRSSLAFSLDDQRLIEQIAARAALALENALLYERAQRERARAEEANRAKDEFLAMLGHELRNPLSPILTAVELMRLRANDTLARERTIIERQANRMVRLVDDLLDVSRVARGKVRLERVRCELSAIVAEAIETTSPLLEERAHRLIVDVPTGGLVVDGDAARLAQVVSNLLANAAKYTPPRGRIEVIAENRGETIVLRVRDDGVGIEPEVLPRIFGLFVQAKQGSDRAQGGLGLGLAIARNLVQLHGGTLKGHSDGPGRGSEFTIELPRSSAGPETAVCRDAGRAAARAVPAAGARRVLVVDDNADAALALADALAASGHDVRIAHDGPSAIQVSEGFRPEVALLDIGLPVMDGYELGRRLRDLLGHGLPQLVAVTGYGQASDRARSAEAGFHAHLLKPIDLAQLHAAIHSVLAASAPGERAPGP